MTRFDLVLMDCMMPKLDGYETARRWRAHEEKASGRRIPIAALTANSTPTDRSRCFECGMDDHLAKPLVWSPLIDLLRRFLPAERDFTVG
jgi:CheY-like chemotaxis protein